MFPMSCLRLPKSMRDLAHSGPRFQDDFQTFARGVDFQIPTEAFGKRTGLFDHFRNFGVVVRRVVVEQEEMFYFGFDSHRHRIIHATVSPTHIAWILVAVVL